MIRSMLFSHDGKIHYDIIPEEWLSSLQDLGGFLWVDFEGTPPEQDEPLLENQFGFHPLAIDDALQETHIPKIDDWGEYIYIVFRPVIFHSQSDNLLEGLELDVFLGRNYLVTHHDQPIEALERVWSLAVRDHRHLQYGPDHLLYRLADEVVAGYMPIIEELDHAIDRIEDQLFDNPRPEVLETILLIKRAILQLRRSLNPQREVLNKLARDDYRVIDIKAQVYFRDVYDHLVRFHDITESMRDMVSGTLDIYLSVINNRMNDVIKTLTIITTLFLPLSFLTGFFGMNFFVANPPISFWVSKPVFFLVLVFFLMTPFVMSRWMRKRGWM